MADLEPENWLTYNGDHRGSVGQLMGPGWGVGFSTVVAAEYDPDAGRCRVHDIRRCTICGPRGQTRLGMVSGDVRAEFAAAGGG